MSERKMSFVYKVSGVKNEVKEDDGPPEWWCLCNCDWYPCSRNGCIRLDKVNNWMNERFNRRKIR